MPGHDLCQGCLEDWRARRDDVEREAAERTEQHEARVEAQEVMA